jgi:2,3-bisphosphoglycerate-independent phosphoglycerate mutase
MERVALIIMDGIGINQSQNGNAVLNAEKPNLDYLFSKYPNTTLEASGKDVGLPPGQVGNSEVGHLNIGAGQIVYTGLSIINNAIENHTFYDNKAFNSAFEHCNKNNSTLHLIGLVSHGGVHSS